MSTKVDEACPPLPIGQSSDTSSSHGPLNIDLPCEERTHDQTTARSKHDGGDLSARSRITEKPDGDLSARSKISERTDTPATTRSKVSDHSSSCDQQTTRSKTIGKADPGCGDVASQTRRDSGVNHEHQYSLSKMASSKRTEPLNTCEDKSPKPPTPRNPITGLGLGEDGVGGIKPKKPKDRRDGNPVTGEGYKSSNSMNNAVPSLNGANQVINKNRIPPGGFSSGLW